jgi:hypothetical protein
LADCFQTSIWLLIILVPCTACQSVSSIIGHFFPGGEQC